MVKIQSLVWKETWHYVHSYCTCKVFFMCHDVPIPQYVKLLLGEVIRESVQHVFKFSFPNESIDSSWRWKKLTQVQYAEVFMTWQINNFPPLSFLLLSLSLSLSLSPSQSLNSLSTVSTLSSNYYATTHFCLALSFSRLWTCPAESFLGVCRITGSSQCDRFSLVVWNLLKNSSNAIIFFSSSPNLIFMT